MLVDHRRDSVLAREFRDVPNDPDHVRMCRVRQLDGLGAVARGCRALLGQVVDHDQATRPDLPEQTRRVPRVRKNRLLRGRVVQRLEDKPANRDQVPPSVFPAQNCRIRRRVPERSKFAVPVPRSRDLVEHKAPFRVSR